MSDVHVPAESKNEVLFDADVEMSTGSSSATSSATQMNAKPPLAALSTDPVRALNEQVS